MVWERHERKHSHIWSPLYIMPWPWACEYAMRLILSLAATAIGSHYKPSFSVHCPVCSVQVCMPCAACTI